MINGFCVDVTAVQTGPVKFDREHQSKGGKMNTTGGLIYVYVVVSDVCFIFFNLLSPEAISCKKQRLRVS